MAHARYHRLLSLFPSHLRPTNHGQEGKRPSAPRPAVWPLKSDADAAAADAALKGQKHLRTQFRFFLHQTLFWPAMVQIAGSEIGVVLRS